MESYKLTVEQRKECEKEKEAGRKDISRGERPSGCGTCICKTYPV